MHTVGTKFFREVILRICDFLCFAGTNHLLLAQIFFFAGKLFCDFQKVPVPSIDNIFVFIEYVQ